jgi:thiamine-phosphate pyrophosphorylase
MERTKVEKLRDALKVYFIMGSNNCIKRPADTLKEAIAGGITLFQFREKGKGALQGAEKYKLAAELQSICKEHHIPFIVNDDMELALSIDADGVHIGQDDQPVEIVRHIIKDKILGASVHTYSEAMKARQAGADYFGLGPIFPTNTKEDAKPVQGLSFIKELRMEGLEIPIVGIGGINQSNAQSVMKAGADGVSVITAISQASDVAKATQELRNAIYSAM